MLEPLSYVIWGSSGHAKVLASLIAVCGGQVVALFDNDDNVSSVLPDVPLYRGKSGFQQWAEETERLNDIAGLVAIGGRKGRDRIAIQMLFKRYGMLLPNVVHPSATVCKTAQLGDGSQILAQAVVAANTRIDSACIVNHHASIDHECALGEGVHVAPGAILCGCVTVGDNAMIGAGAVVLPRLVISSDAVVGAGSVVTHNVAPGVVVVGNPARPIVKF